MSTRPRSHVTPALFSPTFVAGGFPALPVKSSLGWRVAQTCPESRRWVPHTSMLRVGFGVRWGVLFLRRLPYIVSIGSNTFPLFAYPEKLLHGNLWDFAPIPRHRIGLHVLQLFPLLLLGEHIEIIKSRLPKALGSCHLCEWQTQLSGSRTTFSSPQPVVACFK